MQMLSLIIPCYNEEETVGDFLDVLVASVSKINDMSVEYIFVDDGSTDKTAKVLEKNITHLENYKLIKLSRNFGKEAAVTAGLVHCQGDAVIPLDADLQDPPNLIPVMVEKWKDGFEVVLCKRKSRSNEGFVKVTLAKLFYKVFNAVSSTKIPEDVGDFRLMDKMVVDAVLGLPENQRFLKGIFAWVGFDSTTIEYDRPARTDSSAKQSMLKLISLAVVGLLSYGAGMLRIWMMIGLFASLSCLIYALVILIRVIFVGIDVPGYASMMIAIIFIGSLQMVGMGLMGEFLGRIFTEAKRRPVYIIKQTISSSD